MKDKVFSIELKTLPDRISVRLPDRRGGGRVRSARIWRYVPERTCQNVSTATDWHGNRTFVCSECRAWVGKRMYWHPRNPEGESCLVLDCELNYCPVCGAKVVGNDAG